MRATSSIFGALRTGAVIAGLILLVFEVYLQHTQHSVAKSVHPPSSKATLEEQTTSFDPIHSPKLASGGLGSEGSEGSDESTSAPTHSPVTRPKCHFDGQVGKRVVKYRSELLENWNKDGCKQWGLDGPWEKRKNRKIYYAFPFGGELEILHIALEEIYSVVDHIIILEGKVTWRGDKKPLVFPKFNQTHPDYWPKIRYLPYGFDDEIMGARIERCMKESVSGVFGPGAVQCRWLRQWGARDHLVTHGASDIGDNDVFLIADLDELVARQFLKAVKHCKIWPESNKPNHDEEKCSRMGIFTFGHKYHFGCTIDKTAGHYHPDMCLGRCLEQYKGEELRRSWDRNKKYFRQPPKGTLHEAKYVGPAGWHMHAFLSNAQVLWKWYSRSGSGLNGGKWRQSNLNQITTRKKECNEGQGFFSFDALACEPLPHLVTKKSQNWQHFIRYTNDSERPDTYGVEPWYREFLIKHRDSSEKGEPKW